MMVRRTKGKIAKGCDCEQDEAGIPILCSLSFAGFGHAVR